MTVPFNILDMLRAEQYQLMRKQNPNATIREGEFATPHNLGRDPLVQQYMQARQDPRSVVREGELGMRQPPRAMMDPSSLVREGEFVIPPKMPHAPRRSAGDTTIAGDPVRYHMRSGIRRTGNISVPYSYEVREGTPASETMNARRQAVIDRHEFQAENAGGRRTNPIVGTAPDATLTRLLRRLAGGGR